MVLPSASDRARSCVPLQSLLPICLRLLVTKVGSIHVLGGLEVPCQLVWSIRLCTTESAAVSGSLWPTIHWRWRLASGDFHPIISYLQLSRAFCQLPAKVFDARCCDCVKGMEFHCMYTVAHDPRPQSPRHDPLAGQPHDTISAVDHGRFPAACLVYSATTSTLGPPSRLLKHRTFRRYSYLMFSCPTRARYGKSTQCQRAASRKTDPASPNMTDQPSRQFWG